MISKLEKFLFYAFLLFLPFNIKKFLFGFASGDPLTEFNAGFFYLSDVLLLAIFVFWFWRIRKVFFRKKMPDFKIGVFLGIVFLSLLPLIWAKNTGLGFYSFLKIAEGFLLFFYVRSNLKEYSLRGFFKIFVLGGTIQSFIALGQYFFQKSLGLKYLGESLLDAKIAGVAKIVAGSEKIVRAYGTFPHPNILATLILISLFALLLLMTKNEKEGEKGIEKEKEARAGNLLFYVLMSLLMTGLLLTFSRGVIFVGLLAISTIFLWVFNAPKNEFSRLKTRRLFLLFIFYGILLAVIFWPQVSSRVKISPTEQAVGLRAFYNKEALSIIKKAPFFGVGPNNFIFNLSMVKDWQNWMRQPVHNIYLLIASEIGVFGLLLFLSFLFLIFRDFLKSKNLGLENFSFFILSLSFLLIGFFDHFFWTIEQGRLMFFLVLGMLSGMSCLKN